MQSGNNFSIAEKSLLLHHLIVLKHDVEFIFNNIFYKTSRPYLEHLYKQVLAMTEAERKSFLIESPRRGLKRKLELGTTEREYLEHILKENRTMILSSFTKKFHEEFYSASKSHIPFMSKVYSTIKEKFFRKVVSWKNINRNPVNQLNYLEQIAHVPIECLIDIDGIIQSLEDFREKYG